MKKIVQKHLGEILVENQVISPINLEEALKIQKQKGGLLGRILVSLGYATEEAIAHVLTMQYGFPYLPLADFDIDHEIAKIIPEKIAKEYGLVAVDRLGNILTVAMSNPLNKEAIEETQKSTKMNVQVFVSTQTDVDEAVRRAYKE